MTWFRPVRSAPLLLLLLTLAVAAPLTASAVPSVYGDALTPVLSQAQPGEVLPVVIFMYPDPDPAEMAEYLRGVRGEQRRTLLWDEMKRRADAAQDEILDELYAMEQRDQAGDIHSLVLTNAVRARLTPAAIRTLAARRDVRAIEYTPDVRAIEPVGEPTDLVLDELDEIAWHVQTVNAPDAWDLGYDGEGIIVAVMDTGVNYHHQDLENHMWDGGAEFPNHGYDVYSDDNDPIDAHGHGSHVAGIVAGDGTAGTQTGVAPGVRIMAVKIMSDGGGGSLPVVWEGIDWALQHGAHHTTISAGWYGVSEDLHAGNRDAYELARLAGMTNTKSSGNSGNNGGNMPPEEVSAPGWVPSPWMHPDQDEPGGLGGLTTVGSTDSNDNLSDYSSKGPVTWDWIGPWYDYLYDGTERFGLIKPDVTAPGEDITSCDEDNNGGYVSMSGTSMASPCAAGVIALIRSVNPDLTPAEVDEILQSTTLDLGDPGKDTHFGAGRVDAHEAVLLAEETLSPLIVRLSPQFVPYVVPDEGGTVWFDAELRNSLEEPTQANVWTEVILPNGNVYPLDVYTVNFQPDVDINVTWIGQDIPGWAPDGYYEYVAKAGIYPDTVIDEDSFTIIKFGWDLNAAGDWSSQGFTFDNATASTTAPAEAAAPAREFELQGAYPNPFNPATSLQVSLPDAGELTVRVFNTVGREVATLATGQHAAGLHQLTFDARGLASGLYFVQASFENGPAQTQKLMLLR